MPAADGFGRASGGGTARGGGARAWQFLKRNPEFQDAWAARPDELPVFEDAPFPLRRQTEPERGLGRFGLHGWEDPLAADGPASPFWAVAPMLDVVPVRGDGEGLAALAHGVGTGLAGLRLADGALILKLERGGRAQQVRIAGGRAFDPARDSIEVRTRPGPGVASRHARSGELWRLLRVPAPPTGRGRAMAFSLTAGSGRTFFRSRAALLWWRAAPVRTFWAKGG